MGGERNPVASSVSGDGSEQTLVTAWDRALERLPEDWSHLLLEVELPAEAPYHRAAALAGPLNPARCGSRSAFRFRVARSFGYGAAPALARHHLEQLDQAGIAGRMRLLQVLAERLPLDTQGPVWRTGGRSL